MRHLRSLSILLLIFSFSPTLNLFAQTDSIFRFDLSLRYRFEAWNGMNAKNYGNGAVEAVGNLNDHLSLQRLITGFTLTPKPQLKISLHLQDSRAFGWSLRYSRYPDLFKIKEPGTEAPSYTMNPQEQFFEINDAFIQYADLFGNVTLKIGRQKIFYGDNHIFGPGQWGNTGRWTWDAIKFSWRKGEHFVDVFGGGTKVHDPVKIAAPFFKTEFFGGGLYARISMPDLVNIEPFYAHKSEGSADYIKLQSINRNWVGARLVNEKIKGFLVDATYTHQFGTDNNRNISAHGYFVKIGYQFKLLPAKPLISLRRTYASGGKKDDPRIRTFEPAYGASDKYYGWMNIVSWSNLDDREIVLELYPVKGFWIEIKYNRYILPVPEDKVILGNLIILPGKNHLGDEFNIFSRFAVNKHWQFVGAFGYFWPGKVKPINNKPAKPASWLALQALYII